MINNELDEVNKWILSNKNCVNVEKTNYVLFSHRNTAHLSPISIGNSMIKRSGSIKFLGIMVDEHLTFKNHVHYVSNKLSRSVGILNKLKLFLPFKASKSIYFAFILPYLNYVTKIWHAGYQNITERIFVLQKNPFELLII